jgi:hypothetical protein
VLNTRRSDGFVHVSSSRHAVAQFLRIRKETGALDPGE